MFAVLGGPTLQATPIPQVKALLTDLIAALSQGDTRSALNFLSQCRALTQHADLEPLYDHLDAAILRREQEIWG